MSVLPFVWQQKGFCFTVKERKCRQGDRRSEYNMRRKNLMTALLCAAVVAASTVMAPGVVMAEETESVTEASTEAATQLYRQTVRKGCTSATVLILPAYF